MDQNLTHRNHYIPRFYLKNWSLDGKTIQTYSILVSNSKVPYWTQQSIKNSAVWSDFYTRIEGDKEIDDFEHWFDREFETPAKPVFDKLLNGQKISYEEACNERMGILVSAMAKQEGVTEALKAADQMEWVRRMNSIRSRAEEIILTEIVYA